MPHTSFKEQFSRIARAHRYGRIDTNKAKRQLRQLVLRTHRRTPWTPQRAAACIQRVFAPRADSPTLPTWRRLSHRHFQGFVHASIRNGQTEALYVCRLLATAAGVRSRDWVAGWGVPVRFRMQLAGAATVSRASTTPTLPSTSPEDTIRVISAIPRELSPAPLAAAAPAAVATPEPRTISQEHLIDLLVARAQGYARGRARLAALQARTRPVIPHLDLTRLRGYDETRAADAEVAELLAQPVSTPASSTEDGYSTSGLMTTSSLDSEEERFVERFADRLTF